MEPSPPEITISFGGATRNNGNPGIGGAAAVIRLHDGIMQTVFQLSNRMGTVEVHCAEYYGLILALRELLHLYPGVPCNLFIKSDSDVVMKQLHHKAEVQNDSVLKNYHLVAMGLLKEISATGNIKMKHVPKDENHEADALAKSYAESDVYPLFRFFHYPCLYSFLDATVVGKKDVYPQIKVAHNQMAAARTPVVYVDAATLREINGDDALQQIQSCGRKILLEGKADMTILGTTSIQFSFGKDMITIEDARVVDFLPWPLEISMTHPKLSFQNVPGVTVPGFKSDQEWRAATPERFRSHPYWKSKIMLEGD